MSKAMRKVLVWAAAVLGAAGVWAGDSAPMVLDTRDGTRIAGEGVTESIALSGRWNGAAATVTADGQVLATAEAGEDKTVEWTPSGTGLHVLQHRSGGETLEAAFTVLGDDVVLHAGAVAGSETWAAGKVHLVTAAVTVGSGAALTIESGAVVKFMDGTGLAVASGGSCTANGVVFTHVADDSVGGDTMMDGNGTAPATGAYTLSGAITEDDATEERYSAPVVLGGTLSFDTRLQGHKVYTAVGNITIASGVTVTIAPGAIIKMGSGLSVTVASGATLVAQGTRAEPIVCTSAKDDEHGGDTNGDGDATRPQPGDWYQIRVQGTAIMDHCSVLYASSTENYGGVEAYGGTVTFDNGEIAFMKYDSVNAHSSGTFTARNSVIREGSLGLGYYGSGRVKAFNCVFHGLTTAVRQSGKELVNCVFSECQSFTDQGGDGSTFRHCVFWNPPGYGAQSYSKTGSNGNVWANPLFVDADNGDFRVRAGSACIDAGDGTVAPETDYFGRPRMNDPNVADTGVANANGVCPDIGIYEMEGGNAASDVDLEAVRVSAGAEAEVGGELSVEWTVANVGTEKAAGPWRDVVSLVNEASGETVALGETVVGGGLAGKASKGCSGRFTVPAVSEGEWRVKVQVNAYRDVYEGGAVTNNAALSAGTVRIGVAGLGEDGTASGTAGSGSPWTTKVAVPDEGRWVLRVTGPAGTTVRYGVGFVPGEGNASGKVAVGADGSAVLSLPAGTTVYVTVEGKGAVRAELVSAALVLGSVSPAELPGSGTTTLTVKGANFEDGAVVSVGGVAATATEWLNAETLVATVDCASLPAGACAVTVAQGDESASLPAAVTVKREAGKADLKAWLEVPSSVRQGRVVTIYVNYENVGNLDMPAPVLGVVSTGLVFRVGENGYTNRVDLLGLSAEAPVGTLRPGEKQRVAVEAVVAGSTKNVRYSLTSRWAGQKGAADVVPLRRFYNESAVLYPSEEDAAMWAAVREKFGTTWGEFYERLGAFASEMEAWGGEVSVDFETMGRLYARAVLGEVLTERRAEADVESVEASASDRGRDARAPRGGCGHKVTGGDWAGTKDGSLWMMCPTCNEWCLLLESDGEGGYKKVEPLLSPKAEAETYVICHGNMNSVNWEWIKKMGVALVKKKAGANVLAVNWGTTAKADGYWAGSGGAAMASAKGIPGVADEAWEQFRWLKLDAGKTTLIGHSHGGHVAGSIAVRGGGFKRMIGLDTSRSIVHNLHFGTDLLNPASMRWMDGIHSAAKQVEFYRSSWGMSMVDCDQLYGDWNFAVFREGDFYWLPPTDDREQTARHQHAYNWFTDSINGGWEVGFGFEGQDTWESLCGEKDIAAPGTKKWAGMIRDNRVELLSELRMGRSPWKYQQAVLDKANAKRGSADSMPELYSALLRSVDVSVLETGLPSTIQSGDRVEVSAANRVDNLSIDYAMADYEPDMSREWPWRMRNGTWLVDLEGLKNKFGGDSWETMDWASLTNAMKSHGLSVGDYVKMVAESDESEAWEARNAYKPIWAGDAKFANDVFGKDRLLVTEGANGEKVYREVLLAVGACVEMKGALWHFGMGNKLPGDYVGELYPANNIALKKVKKAIPSEVVAAMRQQGGSSEAPGRRSARGAARAGGWVKIADGETVYVEASKSGAWSVQLDGRASIAVDSEFSVYSFTCNEPVLDGKRTRYDFEEVTVKGTLPEWVDGVRYEVQLQVSTIEGTDDYASCVLDVRRALPEPEEDKEDSKGSSVPQSCDPNEMGGPDGVKMVEEGNTNRYVQAGRWMEYSIYFENKADAAAAAQEVRVVNPLSEWLDWDSFEMGEVVFRNQMDMGLSGKASGTSEAALTGNESGWKVKTTLGVSTNGVAEWYLRVVDESTADGWPVDPYAGFLPPNDAEGNGEGRLTYRVKVRDDAPIGVVIRNSAVITFDYNAPIETDPAWWNVVEAVTNVTLEGVAAEGARSGDGNVEVVAGKPFGDLLPTPERTGWTFGGWFTGPDGTGTEVTAETVAGADTLELFAKWVRAVFGELWLDVTHGSVVVGTNGVTAGFGPDGEAVEGLAERYVLTGTSTVHSVRFAGGSFTNTWTNLVVELEARDAVAVALEGASVEVTLAGDSSVASGEDCAGIRVDEASALALQGEGRLKARGGAYAAGIGGGLDQKSGRVEIRGGTVEAQGGTFGAGIGGGLVSPGAEVVITGGSVKARGSRGSDIGAGYGEPQKREPTDGAGSEVHEVEVPLATDEVPVVIVVEWGDGRTYRYEGMGHEGDSSLWFWLPDGTYDFEADGDDYGAHVAGASAVAVFTDPGSEHFESPAVEEVSVTDTGWKVGLNPAYRTTPFDLWTATGLDGHTWAWEKVEPGMYRFDAETGTVEWLGETKGVRVFRFSFRAKE